MNSVTLGWGVRDEAATASRIACRMRAVLKETRRGAPSLNRRLADSGCHSI